MNLGARKNLTIKFTQLIKFFVAITRYNKAVFFFDSLNFSHPGNSSRRKIAVPQQKVGLETHGPQELVMNFDRGTQGGPNFLQIRGKKSLIIQNSYITIGNTDFYNTIFQIFVKIPPTQKLKPKK
jgi:hypothetical protein